MNHLLKLFHLLPIVLILNTGFAHPEEAEPKLSIKEALDLALEKLPEGKEIDSIVLQTDRDGNQWYFAEYGEKVVPYETKEMNANGEYIPCTKYRKMSIGIRIGMNQVIQIDHIGTTSVPRRRVILPKQS